MTGSLSAVGGTLSAVGGALPAVSGGGGGGGTLGDTITTNQTIIPYSNTGNELVNPNRATMLEFGINSMPTGWPGGPNFNVVYDRTTWYVIQTGASTYDWSWIDNHLSAAAAAGKQFYFRIIPFIPDYPTPSGQGVNGGMPTFLHNTSATTARTQSGTTYYTPNYNDSLYLSSAVAFIQAVGARYDHDERLYAIELSMYGDYGENHVSVSKSKWSAITTYSLSGAVTNLGYWCFNTGQMITMASITTLTAALVAAFPNTRIITVDNNPEFCRQLFTGKNNAGATVLTPPTITPGYREDHLAAPTATYNTVPPQEFIDTGSSNPYYSGNDPFVAVFRNWWKQAPIVTECGGYSTWQNAQNDVLRYAISQIASYTAAQSSNNTNAGFVNAHKYAGYRYAASAITAPTSVPAGYAIPVTVAWTNYGVAPTYDAWKITYQLRDSGGNVVSSVDSAFDLKTLYNPGQVYTAWGLPAGNAAGPPLTQSANDTASIPVAGVSAGTYTIAVVVTWNQHKAGGTNVFNAAPMHLAQTPGPNADGSYPLVSIVVGGSGGGGGGTYTGPNFGINVPDFYMGSGVQHTTTASYTYMYNQGVRHVRLPFHWADVQPTLGAALNATLVTALHTEIANAHAAGIAVILDCHNNCRYPNPDSGTPFGNAGAPTQAQFADFWTRMSTEFKGDAGLLGYDLMNEPHDLVSGNTQRQDGVIWEGYSQDAVTAIRGNADTHLIHVEGLNWSNPETWPTCHPTAWITDSANNMRYSCHMYPVWGGVPREYQYGPGNTVDLSYGGAKTYYEASVIPGAPAGGAGVTFEQWEYNRLKVFTDWLDANSVKGDCGEGSWPGTWSMIELQGMSAGTAATEAANWNTNYGVPHLQQMMDAGITFQYWDASGLVNASWGLDAIVQVVFGPAGGPVNATWPTPAPIAAVDTQINAFNTAQFVG